MQKMPPRLLIATFFLVIGIVFLSVITTGWIPTWGFLKIPSVEPPFLDMRTVQWAPATRLAGLDPQLTSVGDPLKRAMNYPILWEHISRLLNLQNENIFLAFELILVGLYLLASFFILLKTRSWWFLVCVFSGASLFAIERGNNDLLVFVCLFLAGLYLSPFFFSTSILFLFNLKIYPVFAATPILKWKSAILPLGALLLLNLVLIWDQLWKIKSHTPLSTGLSYGASGFTWDLMWLTGKGISSYVVRGVLLAIGFLLFFMAFSKNLFRVKCRSDQTRTWFLMGSGVFLSTFLLSSNFDYRLIMMLLCVPYLLCLEISLVRTLALIVLLLALNFPMLSVFLGHKGILINLLAKAILFCIVQAIFLQEVLNLTIVKHVNNSVKSVVKNLLGAC